jgi:rubrerythrin
MEICWRLKMSEGFDSTKTYLALKESFEEEAAIYFKALFFKTIAEYEGASKYQDAFKNLVERSIDQVNGSLDYLRSSNDPHQEVPFGTSKNNLEIILQAEKKQANEAYAMRARIAREEGYFDIASWFDTLEKIKIVNVSNFEKIKKAE